MSAAPLRSPSLESNSSVQLDPNRVPPPAAEADDHEALGAYNCVMALIYCPTHKLYAFMKRNVSPMKPAMFLVTAPVGPADTVAESLKKELKASLTNLTVARAHREEGVLEGHIKHEPAHLIHTLRIQIPGSEHVIRRSTYRVELEKVEDGQHCCRYARRLFWHTIDDLHTNGRTALWGLEPFYFTNSSMQKKAIFEEQSIEFMMHSVRKIRETMATSAGYSDEDVYRLLSEYIHHSFPSQYMSYPAFDSWAKAVGALGPAQIFSYFNAMAVTNGDCLTFNDFLTGLIVGDPNADLQNNPKLRKVRLTLIMSRYLESRRVVELRHEDLKHLVGDLLQIGPIEIDGNRTTNVEELVANIDRKLNIGAPFSMTWEQFKEAVQQNLLPEIYQLFCFKRTFSGCANTGRLMYHLTDESNITGHQSCPSCKRLQYCYHRHEVKIVADGGMDERRAELMTGVVVTDTLKASDVARKKSVDRFNVSSPAMQLINMIRGHCEFHNVTHVLRSNEAAKKKDMWKTYGKTIISIINSVCDETAALLSQDARVIQIASPCYVIGGIHGHLGDLMLIEKQLMKKGAKLELVNYLFCGDFGDDTGYYFETVLYILAMKVLSPGNVHLIRGNYETRSEQSGFRKKTESKAGKELSDAIWFQINKVFDCLSVAAIIDSSILCVHGGIPKSVSSIDELNKCPVMCINPVKNFPALHEVIFGELLTDEKRKTVKIPKNFDGFIKNPNGKGWYYTEEVAMQFLTKNKLTHMIRTHEGGSRGLMYFADCRLMTLMSAANYEDKGNHAYVILVARNKIRGIRIETNPN